MENKTTLFIPDIHHKWGMAEKIISRVGADEVVLLGDYFDDFEDTPQMVNDTCDWLQDSLEKPNRTHLIGNHDQQYVFPYESFRCTGYAQWKHFIIRDNINPKLWEKLKWFHFVDNNRWLCCHAGLHKMNVPKEFKQYRNDRPKFVTELTNYLNHEIEEGLRAAGRGDGSWIFNAGASRGGGNRVGGITWCDYEMEFFPVMGINQIVGHTQQRYGVHWSLLGDSGRIFRHPPSEFSPTPELLDNPLQSTNIGLDYCGNMHYGIWDGKQFTIGDYKSL